MAYTLEELCKDVHNVIKDNAGPAARVEIKGLIEQLLENDDFIRKHLGPQVAEGRHTLYADPELKFQVLAHIDRKARSSPPHDHGRSWAVYGQAIGWSEMGIYQRRDGGTGTGPAELVETERFRINPGDAGVFDIGGIHSVTRSDGGCCYIRVTGEDLEVVPRLKYDLAKKQAIAVESAGISG